MHLLQCGGTGGYHLTEHFTSDKATPSYAVLSHTWGADSDEVDFNDLTNGTGQRKPGYEKIRFCAEQAARDGLQYFWVDACCINQADSVELSKAISSMFQWYRNAARCYVYLSDVPGPSSLKDEDTRVPLWGSKFQKSKWFTRGWTLQELLAPSSVEFFAQDGTKLGHKGSLEEEIHKATGIPKPALQGVPLSQFSVNERLSWKEGRQTKLEEDKAYSLLGLFGVSIPPIYGEGIGSAFQRLLDEARKVEKCLQDARLTDPCDDKKRIENTKGGLLEDVYHWALENHDFQRWRNDSQSCLLWIKGDPGKGKTMLICGIINELNKSMANTALLSYFFCQATDSRINNATAVLRGLIYLFVYQQPSLVVHVRKKYDYAGKTLFEDANAWVALSEIFTDIVQDPSLKRIYLIIDALNECVTDLPKLLNFIIQTSSTSSRIKWIMSSRNWPDIEERLERAGKKVRLSLELNADSVSAAVRFYIKHKVSQLAEDKKYNDQTKDAVLKYLYTNANDTFLWAALVCQNLNQMSRFNVVKKLEAFPPGLNSLYDRMIERINNSDDAELHRHILAIVAVIYRPVTLQELTSLIEELDDMARETDSVQEVVNLCGSLLTIQDGIVYFIHQSAKDFLLKEAFDVIFPSGRAVVHYAVFSRSLRAMSNTLHRDVYQLGALGCPIEQIEQPKPDPLAALRYSCIYWVDHLCEWISNSSTYNGSILMSGGAVDKFMRKKYLYWLEAISLCISMSKGVVSMARLEALTKEREATSSTMEVVRDARRFIMYHKAAIESSPLQVYGALLFSPTRSIIRALFKDKEPWGIIIKPGMQERWSNCLQTLEGHSSSVRSVAFSHDSTRLASASSDGTVKVWDARSGECLSTLEGHSSFVRSVAFSHDSTRLASASEDRTVKVWDAHSGECLQTLEGHSYSVISVAFSHDSTRLASASGDRTVKVWDARSGECLQTLEGHSDWVTSVAFSHDSTRLACASDDHTVKVWDLGSRECLQALKGHSYCVRSVVFSHDSTWLASASYDFTVKVWDPDSGECLQTLKGHNNFVSSVIFSYDSTRLASASYGNGTVKVWDPGSGECLQTLQDHSSYVGSVTFSHDSTRLASASDDHTVKVWDLGSSECLQTLKGHNNFVSSVAFSHDSTWLASASGDGTVKVWDPGSGECLQTLEGHSNSVRSVAFSHDPTQLASASDDRTIKVWDLGSGECVQTLKGHSGWVNSVTFSHDSAWLASTSDDRTVKVWDSGSGECLQTLKGHNNFVSSVTFSHDSTRLAFASNNGTVRVWDPGSGECLQKLKGHNNFVSSVTFSHDSTRLASVSWDTVKVWDLSSSECLQTLEDHSSSVTSVAFSHDSTRLASASGDGTVKVWDPGSGECLQTLEGHSGWVRSVAFSHDSTRLASASDDRTVKVWDPDSGECFQTVNVGKVLYRISFDSSGNYLHNNGGVVSVSALSTATSAPISAETRTAQHQGVTLGAAGTWITHNSVNVLRLPSNYRPSCLAVSGNVIAIGVGNGRVWMCEVQSRES
ncbi:hypothetical protein EJ04DRAFT_543748 [Polyplosphaeria fusca]|uniref:Mitochondrial division protein 1 n=1 Tax=Polyplosphaeria fusca TaxID=682080 RepID=A0A9P4UZG1_9PLEO|nr:hypothetical protein EJ04DRAFT_543748 [Polyplosphaeria fusca]